MALKDIEPGDSMDCANRRQLIEYMRWVKGLYGAVPYVLTHHADGRVTITFTGRAKCRPD